MSGRSPAAPLRANGPTARQMVTRTERQAIAVKMRLQGASSAEIGDALGVTRKTAWALIRDAMEQRRSEIANDIRTLRAIEVERIEGHLCHLRERLEAGDPGAHRAAKGWHERLAKLQGLDIQKEVADGPKVIVVDSRFPWERGDEVIHGEAGEVVPLLGAEGDAHNA